MLFTKKTISEANGSKQVQEVTKTFNGHERRGGSRDYIVSFGGKLDVNLVGHKNAALSEISTHLPSEIKLPDGFIISTDAFLTFLKFNKLLLPISEALEDIDVDDVDQLVKTTGRIRGWIDRGNFPADLKQQISHAYENKFGRHTVPQPMAVRNSLTIDDIPLASLYCQQQSTYLNAVNLRELFTACKWVFASIFSERAVTYCINNQLNPLKIGVAVAVQQMIRSDLASSGVNFSYDPQTGFNNVISISSSYGLGRSLGRGGVTPDEFLLSKVALEKGLHSVIKRQRGSKSTMTILGEGKYNSSSTEILVPEQDRLRFSLSDKEISVLGKLTLAIESYYASTLKTHFPISIGWAKDGITGQFYLIQLNFKQQRKNTLSPSPMYNDYQLEECGRTLVSGNGVGHKIMVGRARVVTDLREISLLTQGEILVVTETQPELEPFLNRAAAIVTDFGGLCCHTAEVAQELNIPAVLGCGNATKKLKTGDAITVVCLQRDLGYVYEGQLQFQQRVRPVSALGATNSDLMLSIYNPDTAFEYSSLPVAGVGLVKMEYVVASRIRVHPRALLEYEGQDPELQFEVDKMVTGYPSRREYYVDKLSEGIATIAAAFYPQPVKVRTSDFRSNEYAALFGGEFFEQTELNPSIGFRGASRYFSQEFQESFALECAAIRKVREEMGFENVELIVPFVRTIEEAEKLMSLMAQFGLRRGEQGLKVHLMCETPANALLIDKFLHYFDGAVVGLDDLTQLTIGVDRESKIFGDFDERNIAVLKLVQLAIDACHRHGKSIGVAGEALTRYPEIVNWLVEKGIEKIIFEPKYFFDLHQVVSEAEDTYGAQKRDTFPSVVKYSA